MMLGLAPRAARTIVATVVALDLTALAALSVHRSTSTSTTTTPLAAAPSTPAAATTAPADTAPPAQAVAPVIAAPTFPAATPAPAPSSSDAAGGRPKPQPTDPSPSGPPAAATAPCPIPLQPPAEVGGLQSLIGLVPVFGPFAAEAFALAPAYSPLLDLLGPIMAKYPELQAQAQPLLGPLFKALGALSNTGFEFLKPLYGPYRQQMLAAEAKLAAAIAPYAEKLAGSSMGTCLIDLEGALIEATVPQRSGS